MRVMSVWAERVKTDNTRIGPMVHACNHIHVRRDKTMIKTSWRPLEEFTD